MVVYLYVKDPVDFSGVNQEQTSRYTEGNQPILGTVQNKNCLHGKLNWGDIFKGQTLLYKCTYIIYMAHPKI